MLKQHTFHHERYIPNIYICTSTWYKLWLGQRSFTVFWSFSFRGSQTGVHVHLGVHLPIWRGTFMVSNRRAKYIYISFISKYLYIYQGKQFSKIIICLLLDKSM